MKYKIKVKKIKFLNKFCRFQDKYLFIFIKWSFKCAAIKMTSYHERKNRNFIHEIQNEKEEYKTWNIMI